MNTYNLSSKFLIFALVFSCFLGISHLVHASANDNVSGWAWSDNIGWISLNCINTNGCGASDYGVSIDPVTGNMAGYAWSDNIGWISFNAAETSGCPTGSCQANININTGISSGWAKALAGNSSSGWDGWISLKGSNYGINLNTGTGVLSGYAWGSSVVGWVQFNGIVAIGNPVLTLTANPATLSAPGSTTLAWTSSNVQSSSCVASANPSNAGWSGPQPASGSVSVPVNQTTTFTISCVDSSGSPISASATVTVNVNASLVLQASSQSVQSGNTIDLTWNSPNHTEFTNCSASANPSVGSLWNSQTVINPPNFSNNYTGFQQGVPVTGSPTTYSLTCTGNANASATATAIVTIFTPTPSVSLSASPASLPVGGGSSALTWTASNVDSCSASANPQLHPTNDWTGQKSTSGGSSNVLVTTTTNFMITCAVASSSSTVSASATVYVDGTPLCSTCQLAPPPKPHFIEF